MNKQFIGIVDVEKNSLDYINIDIIDSIRFEEERQRITVYYCRRNGAFNVGRLCFVENTNQFNALKKQFQEGSFAILDRVPYSEIRKEILPCEK